jgi:hypothetical protein
MKINSKRGSLQNEKLNLSYLKKDPHKNDYNNTLLITRSPTEESRLINETFAIKNNL